MAILDSLISEVSDKFGLGSKGAPLLSGLLSLITNEQTGGLAGFLDQFRRAGLGDLVTSWISRGPSNPVTPSQFETALGSNVIERLASSVGISSNTASSALAFLTPKLIDMLTPDGVVPASLPGWVSTYLGGASAAARQVVGAAQGTGGTMWRTLLPLAALALLVFAGYRYCNRTPEQASTLMGVATPSPTASSVAAVPSGFIEKRLPNGVTLRLPSDGPEDKLIAFIEDPTQQADKQTWFSLNRLEFETNSATLKPTSIEQLRNIYEILKAYPAVSLKIGGYTDNVGNDAGNLKLSHERANSAMREIIQLGGDKARLEAEGYGEQHPVADNATEEGRQRNRRIDVRVTKK